MHVQDCALTLPDWHGESVQFAITVAIQLFLISAALQYCVPPQIKGTDYHQKVLYRLFEVTLWYHGTTVNVCIMTVAIIMLIL